MKLLEGQKALITGAAGGIGRATAARFVEEGARVFLVDRDAAALRDVSEALGTSAVCCVADVSESGEATRYVKTALETFGSLDIAFLNAGIAGTVACIEDTPIDAFDRVMRVNVRGVWLGLAALLPVMKTQDGGGVITLTSSITGVRGSTGQGPYIASKHAVIGLMKTAAIEGAAYKIRVNAICPAPVDTEMMTTIESGISPNNPEWAKNKILSSIPLGRYATAPEIADMVTFLSSSRAAYCTGTAYMIDGGAMAGPVRQTI
jgi:NAD(P)-dependent dehydrogenase (short-subunit alcohol dehydrogenase family)